MIDWFVVLTPLVLLPIALLFLFVGCGFSGAGTKEPDPPPPSTPLPPGGGGTPPPPPGVGTIVGSGPSLTLGTPARLLLTPRADINDIKPGGTNYRVTKIAVEWTLVKGAKQVKIAATPPLTPGGGRVFLDPALDGSAEEEVPGVTSMTFDQGQLTCSVVVTLREVNPQNPNNPDFDTQSTTPPVTVNPFQTEKVYVFELRPEWMPLKAKPRRFTLTQKV